MTANKNKEIPIFFSVDDNYAPFLAAALNSAIKNSSKDRNYRAIVLYRDLSGKNISRLGELATDNFRIDFVPMREGLETITDRLSNRLRFDCFTLTIYFRLFIPIMFPQYEKGIYIDSDVVLLGDLAELYDTDIGDNFIGACVDLSVQEMEPICDYIENAVGVPAGQYVNSGVLLLNMEKLRSAGLSNRFLALLNEYHFDSVAPDQDYLNALCNGNIHYLSPVWDAMPNENIPPIDGAKLVHYNLYSKPWCREDVQYGEHFWHYASDCGFFDEIRSAKERGTDDRKNDEYMQILIDRAVGIRHSELTFKKIHEERGAIRL